MLVKLLLSRLSEYRLRRLPIFGDRLVNELFLSGGHVRADWVNEVCIAQVDQQKSCNDVCDVCIVDHHRTKHIV